jgi:hypothetical protein
MSIPVLWMAQSDGRGRYNCTAALNDMLDRYDCIHVPASKMNQAEGTSDGAVLIVHGGRQIGSIDRVNMVLDDLKWAVVIVLGDEECSFPVEQLQHSNMKIWIQEPIPVRHDFCDRFILDGWTPHTRLHLFDVGAIERDLEWVFAGQVTHERRRACVDALRTIDWGGVVVETKGYCQGVSLREYHTLLRRSLIVPCPSGPFSPDSARVCEALEAGCVPILDDLSPTRKEPGFWQMVFGDNHPFPVIRDWRFLPEEIRLIKTNWNEINEQCQGFWKNYKENFIHWLQEDIDDLCKT